MKRERIYSGALPQDTTDHENHCRPSDPARYLLFSGAGMMESQSLGPDRVSPRARDARGRFAGGSSGNPRSRPPGIPNPKRRVPDLVARPLSAQALSHLLDRKPYLLRPLAAQLLAAAPARHRSGGASRDRPGVVADGRGCPDGVRPGLDGHFARRNCAGGGCTHRAPLADAAARAAAFCTPRKKPCRFRG
jgi:hypothetical protein